MNKQELTIGTVNCFPSCVGQGLRRANDPLRSGVMMDMPHSVFLGLMWASGRSARALRGIEDYRLARAFAVNPARQEARAPEDFGD